MLVRADRMQCPYKVCAIVCARLPFLRQKGDSSSTSSFPPLGCSNGRHLGSLRQEESLLSEEGKARNTRPRCRRRRIFGGECAECHTENGQNGQKQRQSFFSYRVIQKWNLLGAELKTAPSLECFKSRLDEKLLVSN